jgi:hypothetical protein
MDHQILAPTCSPISRRHARPRIAGAFRAFLDLFAKCLLAACFAGLPVHAADAPAAASGTYHFDRTISREVLEHFLARSISVEGLFNGRGDVDENLRMLKALGVKYAGRSLCLWGAENDFLANIERAKRQTPKALAADPEMVLEACVFEIVGSGVEQIAIPDWVFTAFGQPVEKRNFIYNNIIYPAGQRRSMGRGQVPDVSRLETQMWFYYQAVSYIDAGFEGIHFGQVEIMNRNDRGNAQWDRLLTMVRAYAATHARRHMVLCNGHTPSGGLVHDGKLLLDFHAFPLRVKENPAKPGDAILQLGFSDGIYNRSKGGVTFSGWKCEHLPYLVEFDNYGRSRTPGKPGAGPLWIWGYDEITWFAHQNKQYRADWLKYAWDWVRKTDPNGFLQMPGSRTASAPDMRWYFANNPSPACPTGMGDEDAIRAVWAADAAGSAKSSTSSNPMLHQQGTRIVDASGAEVHLRGVNLGGWLLWEGWIFGNGILTSETTIRTRMTQVIGKQDTQQFQSDIQNTFITEADIRGLQLPHVHLVWRRSQDEAGGLPGLRPQAGRAAVGGRVRPEHLPDDRDHGRDV